MRDTIEYIKNTISQCCKAPVYAKNNKPVCDKCGKECKIEVNFNTIYAR